MFFLGFLDPKQRPEDLDDQRGRVHAGQEVHVDPRAGLRRLDPQGDKHEGGGHRRLRVSAVIPRGRREETQIGFSAQCLG